MKKFVSVLVVLAIFAALVGACSLGKQVAEEPIPRSTYNTNVYTEQGGAKLVIASGGELEVQDGATLDVQETMAFTLGADEYLQVDGDTTNQTQTAGALNVDVGSTTANVSGLNVTVTTDDGTTAATDVFGGIMTIIQNDADADAFGLKVILDATANAAANSYEYGLMVDCEENSAGACLDGLLVTSSGVNAGMTDGVDVSASNIGNAVNIGSNPIAGGNSDSVSVGATNNAFLFTVDSTNTATFSGADAASPANTTYDTTGAGAITIGSGDVTAITLTTDGTGTAEVVLPNGSVATAEIADDTITFGNISDSSAVDADTKFTMGDGIELELEPSHTTGDTEVLLIDFNQVDDGAATDDAIMLKMEVTSESDDAGDTLKGLVIGLENGTANTIMDAGIEIDNAETTAATMTDAVLVTSSGVANGVTDALDVSAANIQNAINIGDNDVVVGTTAGIKNSSTGSVIVNFHDYADTADDDMAHAVLTTNCTTATSGNEDCDFSIGVAEAGNAAETRFAIDADSGVDIGSANSNDVVLTSGTSVATFYAPAAAGSGGDVLDLTHTYGAMDGSDASIGIDINLTGADHSGTGNSLVGLDMDLTTADAQVWETAIDLNDSDWDVAIKTGDVPIMNTSASVMLDFFGDTVPAEVVEISGTDPQAVQAIQTDVQFGEYQITSGDDDTNCAASCEGAHMGRAWSADQGSLVFEARLHIDTAVANDIVCVGLTDNSGVEMPAVIGSTDNITTTASDALVFCYDSTSTTDEWFAIGVAANTDATGNGAAGAGPTADTYQVFRIEVDAGGADARFYIDGSLAKTLTANAVTAATLLAPGVWVDTNAAESNVVDVDYIFVSAQRQ